jgi:hypothetical protein
VRTLIRAALLLAGAAGLSLVLSAAASADMVEPKSAYQPASVELLNEKAAADAMPEPAKTEATERQAKKAKPKAEKPEAEKLGEVAEPTPAPEQVVRQAPAHLTRSHTQTEAPSVADRIVHPFRTGLEQIGAALGRAVSACEVGAVPGAGGPALALAVLSLAAPLIRRRIIGIRRTADEDVPEFLYAQELTPPG